ncbi:protein JASON-like isoform X2 [Phragmites australis]|uniref:protein JASON-like isoform X2 n=1 Tax=Phragmites australis TaxID=29695 RepID=UPI002D7A2074|nr:protein JASON-like isoform X2 [Phragmites australis]
MCRCAAAIARVAVAFLYAVLVGCFRSLFRTHPGSGRSDALVHRDRVGEVLWDGEQGLGRSGRSCEDLADGAGIDEEELRFQCDNMPINAPATNCTSLFEANSSEGCKCEEHHTLRPELNIEYTHHIPVIRDDMQTPGTIYTSHRGASMSAKRVRTRKQFIYPVLRPIENSPQRMELAEDFSPLSSSNPPKRRNLGADFIKKPKQISSPSVAKQGLSKSPSFSSPDDNASYHVKEAPSLEETKCQVGSVDLLDDGELSKSNSNEKHAALSLSHWLKPSSSDVENQGDVKCAAGDQSYDECNLLTERPVFMASDLKWDVENPTPRLPKTWDGNGIPNTTTRYKEDQKVSWHTTPFEKRLLKVLSEEELHPPSNVVRGKLFHLEEKAK